MMEMNPQCRVMALSVVALLIPQQHDKMAAITSKHPTIDSDMAHQEHHFTITPLLRTARASTAFKTYSDSWRLEKSVSPREFGHVPNTFVSASILGQVSTGILGNTVNAMPAQKTFDDCGFKSPSYIKKVTMPIASPQSSMALDLGDLLELGDIEDFFTLYSNDDFEMPSNDNSEHVVPSEIAPLNIMVTAEAGKKCKRWTADEDAILYAAVRQQIGPPYNWTRISTVHFKGTRRPLQVHTTARIATPYLSFAFV
jgi:hypothetical protein